MQPFLFFGNQSFFPYTMESGELKMLFFLVSFLVAQAEPYKNFGAQLAKAGESIADSSIVYDPAYVRIPYPNGDVPANTGVCTDVIIRAYRKMGIDLQKEVHEDIKNNPSKYPNIEKPDTNIDHRRVPNLARFFARHGMTLSADKNAEDFLPGDIVWWKLDGPKGLNHIGLVVDKRSRGGGRPLVIHNIGGGQVIEDILFSHHIHRHYRYRGK